MIAAADYEETAKAILATVHEVDLTGWILSRNPYSGRRRFKFFNGGEGLDGSIYQVEMQDYSFAPVYAMRIGYVPALKRAWWDAPTLPPIIVEDERAEENDSWNVARDAMYGGEFTE